MFNSCVYFPDWNSAVMFLLSTLTPKCVALNNFLVFMSKFQFKVHSPLLLHNPTNSMKQSTGVSGLPGCICLAWEYKLFALFWGEEKHSLVEKPLLESGLIDGSVQQSEWLNSPRINSRLLQLEQQALRLTFDLPMLSPYSDVLPYTHQSWSDS